jgi:hypothetical protein
MSDDVRDEVMEARAAFAAGRQQGSDTWEKSYTYLRTAMVALLVGLGAAVGYQTWRQEWDLLGSVSAYYYTPAQAIFVGALIGLGACMIALKGTNVVEDLFLNLGGIFAAVVAIVPTSRGTDHRTAVDACEQVLTEKATTNLDCPTVRALEEATAANVENNMFALLVVGALALVATVYFARGDRRWNDRGASSEVPRTDPNPSQKGSRQKFWWGLLPAVVVWAAGGAGLWRYESWLIDHAHYIAAGGLFICIVVVAVANALRHEGKQTGGATALEQTVNAVRATGEVLIRKPNRRDPYVYLAWAMLVGAGIMLFAMWRFHMSLFWVEIVVALLFVLFWFVQTIERPEARDAGRSSAS